MKRLNVALTPQSDPGSHVSVDTQGGRSGSESTIVQVDTDFVVGIIRTDEGLVVDVWRIEDGRCSAEPDGSTYVFE